jgi:hypothetical protein
MIALSSWPSRRQPIDNGLWHHDLATRRDLIARIVHESSGADVLVDDELCEPLVLALRKNGELLAARGFDELNLGHDPHDIFIANLDIAIKRDTTYCDSVRRQ